MEDTSQPIVIDQRFVREKLTLWDAKESPTAALSEKQIESYMEINHLNSFNPLPIELPVDDVLSRLTTSSSSLKDDQKFVDHVETYGTIGNVQQFFTWFDE